MSFITFDDFESGDFSAWDTADSAWSISTSPVYQGTYSATGDGYSEGVLTGTVARAAYPRARVAWYAQQNSDAKWHLSDSSANLTSIELRDSNGNPEVTVSNNLTGIILSSGSFYEFTKELDYQNGQYRVIVSDSNGSTVGTSNWYSFDNAASAVDTFKFTIAPFASQKDYTIDAVEYDDGVPDAPTALSAVTSNGDDVDLSWSLSDDSENEVRVYRAEVSGSSTADYTQIVSLSAGTESYTDQSLEDGELFYYRVTAVGSLGESDVSNEASATTDVPAPSQPTLGNASAGSVSISWDKNDDSSDGDTEIYRSTDGSLGAVVDTLSPTATTHTDSVSEGEEYFYTVRRNTDHSSADSPQASIISTLPTPTDLSVDDINFDGFDISWTDNATDETDYRVRVDGSTVATLPANTESHTITDLARGETYEITVEAVGDDTSSPATINASLPAVPTTRVPAQGWEARLIHASGVSKRPDIAGDPQINPVVNGRPTVTAPTRRDESWFNSSWDDAQADVWKDGQRLNVDRLETRDTSPSESTLTLSGGYELRKRVSVEYDTEEIHTAVNNLVSTYTSYNANVDTPDTEKELNTEVQQATTSSDFASIIQSQTEPENPIYVDAGSVKIHNTADPRDAIAGRDGDNGNIGFTSGDEYNDGNAWFGSSAGDYISFSVTWPYDLPAERVGIKVRDDLSASSDVSYRWDGAEFERVTGSSKTLSWVEIGSSSFYQSGRGYQADIGTDLSSGQTHELKIEVNSDSGYNVDCIAVYDTKYGYEFPNPDASTNGGGSLSGPSATPDSIDVEFEDHEAIKAVTGGKVDVTMPDTSGDQQLALSNDRGATYPLTVSNATTLEGDFTEIGSTLRLKVTLSNYGTQSTFPTDGANMQSLDSYTLYADLEDIPLVINRSFDTSLEDILKEFAEIGDFVWSFERDQLGNGSIEWTQPGQRTSTNAPRVANYSVTRRTDQQFQRIIVKGSASQRVGERVVADHGATQPLTKDDLVEGKEAVYNPDTGDGFERDTDYEVDYQSGDITTLSSGDMVEGTVYAVDYAYRTSGSVGRDGATGLETKTVSIPGLTTDRSCELTALTILQELEDPLIEAEATISDVPPGWSVIDEVPAGALPGDSTYQIREIQTTPRDTRLRLGSRESLSEMIDDLRNRVDAVSRLS